MGSNDALLMTLFCWLRSYKLEIYDNDSELDDDSFRGILYSVCLDC